MSLIKNEERSTNEHLKWLIANSNRYLLIDKEELPMSFDYDFMFSTSDLEHIGNIGKGEGEIRRSELLFHGYKIFFNSVGKIVRIADN